MRNRTRLGACLLGGGLLTGCDEVPADRAAVEGDPSAAYGIVRDARFTGGGCNLNLDDGTKVTFGYELRCDGRPPNNLQVNWDGNRFHLLEVTYVDCTDNPEIDPEHPTSPADTLYLEGSGRYNGEEGYDVVLSLEDDGEPGTTDRVAIRLYDGQELLLAAGGGLDCGNTQAHRQTGRR